MVNLLVRSYHLSIMFMLVFNALIYSPFHLEMVLGILLHLHQQDNVEIVLLFAVERLMFRWR